MYQEEAARREDDMEERASALESLVESLRQDLEVGRQTGGGGVRGEGMGEGTVSYLYDCTSPPDRQFNVRHPSTAEKSVLIPP